MRETNALVLRGKRKPVAGMCSQGGTALGPERHGEIGRLLGKQQRRPALVPVAGPLASSPSGVEFANIAR